MLLSDPHRTVPRHGLASVPSSSDGGFASFNQGVDVGRRCGQGSRKRGKSQPPTFFLWECHTQNEVSNSLSADWPCHLSSFGAVVTQLLQSYIDSPRVCANPHENPCLQTLARTTRSCENHEQPRGGRPPSADLPSVPRCPKTLLQSSFPPGRQLRSSWGLADGGECVRRACPTVRLMVCQEQAAFKRRSVDTSSWVKGWKAGCRTTGLTDPRPRFVILKVDASALRSCLARACRQTSSRSYTFCPREVLHGVRIEDSPYLANNHHEAVWVNVHLALSLCQETNSGLAKSQDLP